MEIEVDQPEESVRCLEVHIKRARDWAERVILSLYLGACTVSEQ
jgi:hypothetical protein